jgi:hypothetical protein
MPKIIEVGNATDLYLLTVSPWDERGLSEEAYYEAQRELAELEARDRVAEVNYA